MSQELSTQAELSERALPWPSGRAWLLTGSLVVLFLGLGLWVRLIGDGLPQPDRLWAALSWLTGSLGVYFLARRLAGNAGALVSLALSLFLPFAVTTSREELAAPFGISCLVWCLYALTVWSSKESRFWALAAALLGGLAGAARGYLFFPAAFGLSGLLFASGKNRLLWKSGQAWMILAGMILLPVGLGTTGIAHPLDGLTFGLNPQVLQPWWVVRWLNLLRAQVDLNLILVGLLGVVLLSADFRGLLLGGWIGYALAAVLLSQDSLSNISIHLVVVLLAALSILPVTQAVFRWITAQSRGWQIAFSLLLVLTLAYAIHNAGA